MLKKLLVVIFVFALLCNPASSEEKKELATDYITNLQNEISRDIVNLRKSIEEELADFKIESFDVSARIQEINTLNEKASEDVNTWEFSEGEKENYIRLIPELSVNYQAYWSLINEQNQNPLNQASKTSQTPEDDVTGLKTIESPDINISDALRLEIAQLSRGIETQVFYLQSKLSKLKLDVASAKKLRTEIQDAQSGKTSLDNPKLRLLELENNRINIAISRIQVRDLMKIFEQNISEIQRLRGRLASFQKELLFPEELLKTNLEKIKTRLDELTAEINNARKSLNSANTSLIRAKNALGSGDIMPFTQVSSNYLAREARVNYWEYMVAFLDDEIALTRETRQLWNDRYKLFHDEAAGDEIWKIRDNAQKRLQELNRQLESVRNFEGTILKEIESLQVHVTSEGISPNVQQNLLQAIDNKRKTNSEVLNRYEALIPNVIFLEQRLYNEANDNLSALRLAEKVGSFSYDTVMGFLNTQLWEGEGYSVTVKKLIIAVAVLLSSFFLSSWGSNLLKRRILKRAKSSISAANAIQRIVFYLLWIAFALIALNIVDIPLTAFAFMGGAIAVGIGFGMQNIFNNLISGFIVIFSRPFKVNDIIDVAGTTGTVTDIGSRSTTIKTWDSFDVVLPNRYFLENSVTNWTGKDTRKREILKVGVSYNSDSRHVEELLLDVAKGHSKVLKDPQPFVIFKNFGDNSLDFEVYFWIDLRQSSGAKVASDMRHHISALFRKEGIEIPFPQRDIHIIQPKESQESSQKKAES